MVSNSGAILAIGMIALVALVINAIYIWETKTDGNRTWAYIVLVLNGLVILGLLIGSLYLYSKGKNQEKEYEQLKKQAQQQQQSQQYRQPGMMMQQPGMMPQGQQMSYVPTQYS